MQVFGFHDSGESQDVNNDVLKTVYLTYNPNTEVQSFRLNLHTEVILLQILSQTEVNNNVLHIFNLHISHQPLMNLLEQ